MKNTLWLLIFYLISANFQVYAQDDRVKVEPKNGDGIITLLKRYEILSDKYVIEFKELNQSKLTQNNGLLNGVDYLLPIVIYRYDSQSIRSTIGNPDWDNAVRIQNYNERMYARGLKPKDYKQDKILWVPYFGFEIEANEVVDNIPEKEQIYPIFGEKYQKIEKIDNSLSNMIFYIVSGHGGPDPGAIGYRSGKELHEEEYAYDVSLRFARRLMEHGADVKIIVQDDDGIRDERFLNNSDDEKYIGGYDIDRDQLTRLQKRAEIINKMYQENLSRTKDQYVIITHVDSRITNKMIDIFFYYNQNSSEGKQLAETLLETIEEKYRQAQPGRGYEGSVSNRNLYMLRKTLPVSIYIELGNIQNERDQRRIIEVNNRQAIANWLTDGIIKHMSNK